MMKKRKIITKKREKTNIPTDDGRLSLATDEDGCDKGCIIEEDKIVKKMIVKEDGRYLIFYNFKRP